MRLVLYNVIHAFRAPIRRAQELWIHLTASIATLAPIRLARACLLLSYAPSVIMAPIKVVRECLRRYNVGYAMLDHINQAQA